mgnify:CR=1 FL=1
MFFRPEDAMKAIEQDGFNWRLVREYFRFTDAWLSEGQYGKLLDLALASIENDVDRNVLLDMLDLEYAVFLEQVALQERMLGQAACDEESVAFGERVMAYLQINSNNRPGSNRSRKSARSALFEIPPGTLISRLLGESAAPATRDFTAQQEDQE